MSPSRIRTPQGFTSFAGSAVTAALFAVLVGSSAGASAQTQGEPSPRGTTLPELVRLALDNAPQSRTAQHRTAAAEARLDEAIFSPYFQFQVTGAFTLTPEATGTPVFSPDSELPLGNAWGPAFRIGIEGALPIYTFGKLSAIRRAARAGLDATMEEAVQERAGLTYDVRRAYYGLQFALDIQQMVSEGQGRLESAAESLEQRIEEGDPEVNEHDRFRLSTTLAEVEGRRSEAVRLERTARAALSMLTGLDDVQVPDCPLEPLVHELEDPSAYVTRALDNRPELSRVRAGLRAREAEQDLARARLLPDLALGLSASYSYAPHINNQNNPFVADPANQTALGAALILRWSLDVPGNHFRLSRTTSQLAADESQSELLRRAIALEVRSAVETASDAERRVEAWGRGHRDARSWFVAAASGYQVGAVEPSDLVDAVRAYFTARLNHLRAIQDFNTALGLLERTTGSPVGDEAVWGANCEDDEWDE